MSETLVLTSSSIPGLPRFSTGKVRDVYDLGDRLLIVTSDRISAFDCVMTEGIPGKGEVLTDFSKFWFVRLLPVIANHLMSSDNDFVFDALNEAGVELTPRLRSELTNRSMVVVKSDVFQVECVVRGYISGSLWKEYVDTNGPARGATLHGHALPSGLRESDQLEKPIFTPATKAQSGHDENIDFGTMAGMVGEVQADRLRSVSLELYSAAARRALAKGIIIADTKFEFGMHNGNLLLVDEALTPDSSRFWDVESYEPGRSQASFDKQYLRDWLLGCGWNREPPPPALPIEVVNQTSSKYREAYRRIAASG